MGEHTMKHVILIILLFAASALSFAMEEPAVLLPLGGTVFDEYKQEVRSSKVQVMPVSVQTAVGKEVGRLYETAGVDCSASGVAVAAAGVNIVRQNGSGSVAVKSVKSDVSSALSAVTMEKIRKKHLPSVSVVSAGQTAVRRAAAADSGEDETLGQRFGKRRLGGSGSGMGGESGDDPNRSNLSPVGEGYVLLLFALLYGGYAIYRKRKEVKKVG